MIKSVIFFAVLAAAAPLNKPDFLAEKLNSIYRTTPSTSAPLPLTSVASSTYVAPTTSVTTSDAAPTTAQAPVITQAAAATTNRVQATTSTAAAAATTAASSGSTSDSSSGFMYSGDITWYNIGVGTTSCGGTYSDSGLVVAVSSQRMNNGANPNANPYCGKKINIFYKGKVTQAKIADTCWDCSVGDLDLDPSLFRIVAGNELKSYLPKSDKGCVVCTTRNRKVAVKMATTNVIEVPEMDAEMAMQLLRQVLIKTELLTDHVNAMGLLRQLTFLLLAIVQAAAYINENGIALSDYLSLLDEQEQDVVDLLGEHFEDDGRYQDIKNPVATAWLILFEQIQRFDPLAAEYLSFVSCVDSKGIP